jgi:DNA repair exonuclease SbcCD ATPase subunit
MTHDIQSSKEPDESTAFALTKGMEMMIAGFIPNTRYFDSRFDLLQVQIDLMQKGQTEIKSQIIRLEDQVERRFERSDEVLKEFKNDVDKRFEKSDQNLNDFKLLVDKRFEKADQNLNDFKLLVDKRFEQVDKRFEKADQHLNDFKLLVDKRFEQVDARFEKVDKQFEKVDKRLDQIVTSIERLTEKLDHRDEKQRGFTIRMFTVAITVSFFGVLGTMLKLIGII